MNEVRHPIDVVSEAVAKVAFIRVAVGALCEVNDGLRPHTKAWEGLYYLTQDIEDMLQEASQNLPQ